VTHWGSVERRDVRRCSNFAFRWISLATLVAALGLVATCATAASAKVVRFHGYRLSVPAAWPVYQLARRPRTCVRFDRHAIYLGTPSSVQNCPAHAVGRTESLLISAVGRSGGEVFVLDVAVGYQAEGESRQRLADRAALGRRGKGSRGGVDAIGPGHYAGRGIPDHCRHQQRPTAAAVFHLARIPLDTILAPTAFRYTVTSS